MIKNSYFSDRLNDFKSKKNFSSENLQSLSDKPLLNLLGTVIIFFTSILRILVFGYSIKLIFNTEWNFFSIICIGLAINFLLLYIRDLISNKS